MELDPAKLYTSAMYFRCNTGDEKFDRCCQIIALLIRSNFAIVNTLDKKIIEECKIDEVKRIHESLIPLYEIPKIRVGP